MAVLVNSNNPTASPNIKEAKAAAGVVGIEVHVANVQTDSDFEPAFQAMARDQVGALLVGGDQFHLSRREKITALAARFRIPAAYYSREYIAAGGLICYGTDINDAYRQVGRYAGRILDGVKPADLPVQQAAKFELVLNLKTARALNLEVPPILLARADEVIE
jgi:putative ABC transport system substrate-binding protein